MTGPLEAVLAAATSQPPDRVEWSIAASARGIAADRYTLWFDGGRAGPAGDAVLAHLGAPDHVRRALRGAGPLRSAGIGSAAAGDGAVSHRLYVDADGPTGRSYRAVVWDAGGARSKEGRSYMFHRGEHTGDGRHWHALLGDVLAAGGVPDAAQAPWLAAATELKTPDGFWTRRRKDRATLVDFVHVHTPHLHTLAGPLGRLCELVGADASWIDEHRRQPVRHVGIAASGGRLSVRVYFAAVLAEPLPLRTLDDVRTATLVLGAGCDLDAFYGDGDLAHWRAVLGDDLHYHAGLWRPGDSPEDDDAGLRAAGAAVRALYGAIPKGARVLDVGCGWGGPLRMLTGERGCDAVGVTASRAQAALGGGAGLDVRHADVERDPLPAGFDVALLLESLSHVADKRTLLARLGAVAGRLVMRVNCTTGRRTAGLGGSMHVPRPDDLRDLLGRTGWEVVAWRDRRPEALPSVLWWRRRLRAVPPGPPETHLEALRRYCDRVAADPAGWAAANPLIEVHAVRAVRQRP